MVCGYAEEPDPIAEIALRIVGEVGLDVFVSRFPEVFKAKIIDKLSSDALLALHDRHTKPKSKLRREFREALLKREGLDYNTIWKLRLAAQKRTKLKRLLLDLLASKAKTVDEILATNDIARKQRRKDIEILLLKRANAILDYEDWRHIYARAPRNSQLKKLAQKNLFMGRELFFKKQYARITS